jgi:hypothetical protein
MVIFDRYTVCAIVLVGCISTLLALILGRRTSWSQRRVTWIAASPTPALGALLAIAISVEAMTASKEQCGVDACGMAMMAAFELLFTAGMAFIFSAIAAYIGYWISKR